MRPRHGQQVTEAAPYPYPHPYYPYPYNHRYPAEWGLAAMFQPLGCAIGFVMAKAAIYIHIYMRIYIRLYIEREMERKRDR